MRTYEEELEMVKKDGLALEYVKDQTPELCLDAVRRRRDALKFVDDQYKDYVLENL